MLSEKEVESAAVPVVQPNDARAEQKLRARIKRLLRTNVALISRAHGVVVQVSGCKQGGGETLSVTLLCIPELGLVKKIEKGPGNTWQFGELDEIAPELDRIFREELCIHVRGY